MSYENINKFVNLIRKYQEADLDVVIAVSGVKGSGKSSFAIQVAKRYVEKYIKEPFNVKKYIAYDNKDVQEKVYELKEYSPIIADEAARFAMGEDWNKSENKEMKKLFAQMRTKHLCVFMIMPKFSWMDRKYKDDMINLWAWLPTRAYAMVMMPDANEGQPDTWHIKDFNKIFKKRLSFFTPIESIMKRMKKHPCYSFTIQFPKVEERLYERYLKLRNEYAFEGESNKYSSQKELAKIMSFNIYERWEEFKKAVINNRLERPTYKNIQDVLLANPLTKKSVISSETTIRNWVQEYNERVIDNEN